MSQDGLVDSNGAISADSRLLDTMFNVGPVSAV